MSPSVGLPLKPAPFPALCGPARASRLSSHAASKPCQPLAIIASAAALGSGTAPRRFASIFAA